MCNSSFNLCLIVVNAHSKNFLDCFDVSVKLKFLNSFSTTQFWLLSLSILLRQRNYIHSFFTMLQCGEPRRIFPFLICSKPTICSQVNDRAALICQYNWWVGGRGPADFNCQIRGGRVNCCFEPGTQALLSSRLFCLFCHLDCWWRVVRILVLELAKDL